MQATLFGEPPLNPARSQWWTPPWLARRLAGWVPRGARILEPSCGRGNLLAALRQSGHSDTNLTGVEIDPVWAAMAAENVPGARIVCGDFFAQRFERDEFDLIVCNPPFEGNAHLAFVLRGLEIAPAIAGIFPVSFQFSKERDRALWSAAGIVTRRAVLPERVDYGGDQSPSFDSVALLIERRKAPRARGEAVSVSEEVWLNG